MLDALSWEVMNATADDWESLEQILPAVRCYLGPATAEGVAEAIARLFRVGLLEARHADVADPLEAVDPRRIVSDPVLFWFRMTQHGRVVWDAEAPRFSSGPDRA